MTHFIFTTLKQDVYLILDFLESFFFNVGLITIYFINFGSVTKGRYNILSQLLHAIFWAQWAQEQQISSQIKNENGQWHGSPN